MGRGAQLVFPAERICGPAAYANSKRRVPAATQPVRIFAQPEKPVALLDPFKRTCAVQHTLAIDDLFVRLERFTPDAVPAGVRLGVETVRRTIENPLDQCPDANFVRLTRGSDEPVIRNSECGPGFLESACDFVHLLLRCTAFLCRRLRDLLSMLVHARDEQHVVTAQAMVTRQYVGADFLEGVTQMWVAIRVIDGCSDVVLFVHAAI